VNKPDIFAHRGCPTQAPENSLVAFQTALPQSDGFECDIQLTRDGVAVLWHDDTLERLGRSDEEIRHFNWSDLQKINIACLCKGYEHSTKILDLETYLTTFSHRTNLLLEIKKEPNTPKTHQQKKIRTTQELVKTLTLPENYRNVTLSSFDQDTLNYAYQNNPKFNYVLNIEDPLTPRELVDIYKSMRFLTGVCFDLKLINRALSTMAEEFNLKKLVYTVNDERGWEKAIDCHMDIVISDVPGKLRFLAGA
jgi:glycerophosphoryl diester phosphodiesterase